VVYEGVLHCPDTGCQLEYPIIDGIPLLFPDIRSYITDNLVHITARIDLSELSDSILGDCAGPNSQYDITRQHLSSYTWDNYADLDENEPEYVSSESHVKPGGVKRCLLKGLELIGHKVAEPIIDLGCSVGRSSFELAEHTDQLVLGIDNNFSMLRLAQQILNKQTVSYPRRRVGIVYDRREFKVNFKSANKVDFWACDALSLPFSPNTFGLSVGLQVLDSVPSPHDLLESISCLLRPGGSAILASPYDWSPAVTPIEAWIGGHSQRGENKGASEPLLKSLLTPGAHPQSIKGLKFKNEVTDFPWHTRIHNRGSMMYQVHIFTADAISTQ